MHVFVVFGLEELSP